MSELRVVIVSGGSRGLGKAMLQDLMEQRYAVATFSRSRTGFIDAMEGLNSENFMWRQLDVTNTEATKTFVKDVYKQYGRIDGLINNAGATLDKLLPLTTDEELEETLMLNLQSVISLTRQVTRLMLIQQSGSIINISSILGHRGFKGVSVYGATKAALDGFSRGLARELGVKGIRVNSISPGFLATDMTHGMAEGRRAQIVRRTPMGRLGTVEDITGLARFLLSDESRFITGQSIIVDGGLTC